MSRFHPLPTHEPHLWPAIGEIVTTPGNFHDLGHATLDGGVSVAWGDGLHWVQVPEATSPRGVVWRLNNVCWLSVNATVLAPRPGLYAAFIRIKQTTRSEPLLDFAAEWKVDASPNGSQGSGFLGHPSPERPPISRQESEAVYSWSHSRRYNEANPGGWLLFHIGNVMVRGSNAQHTTSAGAPGNAQGNALDVRISFGGENPYWCDNIVVDFSAIAPVLLSWDIVRVVLIGNRKGHTGTGGAYQRDAALNDVDTNAAGIGCSPLASLPQAVIDTILEFSQPTLVRPVVEDEQPQQGGESGAERAGDATPWTVF